MTAARARCYSIFHLNLAYSSIELAQRSSVIERCYWPLLELARTRPVQPGIELSGYTLSVLRELAPDWVAAFRTLLHEGRCELIGSGYSQLIGPLVPADVNVANLRLGLEDYATHLGVRPRIALVHEQAYSGGLVPLYLDAGYEAIAMEWNNPAARHPEWPRTLRDAPQRALGADGRSIGLVWIDTIVFQQLQRYAHGELELDAYRAFLERRLPAANATPIALPLYGNDVEIFDFRPGRFHTEAAIDQRGEWLRIQDLIDTLLADPRFEHIAPSVALDAASAPATLRLESSEEPIPVKKQEKYNVTRWAVTGRNDLDINTACWRLQRALQEDTRTDDTALRQLCRFWSSDFRTHITADRWRDFRAELNLALARHAKPAQSFTHETLARIADDSSPDATVRRSARLLHIDTPHARVVLDLRRGLTIRSLAFAQLGELPILGTIAHGHYDEVSLAADFYTGHTVIEFPGASRVTDLSPVDPTCHSVTGADGERIRLRAVVSTPLGPVTKTVDVFQHVAKVRVRFDFDFDWDLPRQATFRTGFVTILPGALERRSLFYRTHNGGRDPETFALQGHQVRHAVAVSPLVSARCGLGATEGRVTLGDARRALSVRFDPATAAALPMLDYRDVGDGYWLRLLFSLGELDETRTLRDMEEKQLPMRSFELELSPELA